MQVQACSVCYHRSENGGRLYCIIVIVSIVPQVVDLAASN